MQREMLLSIQPNTGSITKGSLRAHMMSVDVEDYFMVEAFAGSVSRNSWDSWPSRVEMSTRRALNLFDQYNVKGTFFLSDGWPESFRT